MLGTILALESQASRLNLGAHNRGIVAFVQDPQPGPQTSNASVDVNPTHRLEESKNDLPSPQEDGDCEQPEIGGFQIADNQILIEEGDEKNKKDLFPKGEIQFDSVQSNPVASLMPTENELEPVQIVEDTEDLLIDDNTVDILSSPDRELPLKPSATEANQEKSLVQKTQDQCKLPGNSKTYSCSPEIKHTRKSKVIPKRKQNFNTVRLKDQKVDMSLSSRVRPLYNVNYVNTLAPNFSIKHTILKVLFSYLWFRIRQSITQFQILILTLL